MSVKTDYDRSFEDLVEIKPCLEKYFGCELLLIDKRQDRLQAFLDQVAGIDAVAEKNGKPLSFGFRVQRGINYATHTVRYKRASGLPGEYQKFDPDSRFGSQWTVQVYIGDGVNAFTKKSSQKGDMCGLHTN